MSDVVFAADLSAQFLVGIANDTAKIYFDQDNLVSIGVVTPVAAPDPEDPHFVVNTATGLGYVWDPVGLAWVATSGGATSYPPLLTTDLGNVVPVLPDPYIWIDDSGATGTNPGIVMIWDDSVPGYVAAGAAGGLAPIVIGAGTSFEAFHVFTDPVNRLKASANGTMVAVGKTGDDNHRSTDGGLTWTQHAGTATSLSRAVGTDNNGSWMISYFDGTTSISTDDGLSWSALATFPTGDMWEVCGGNAAGVFIASEGGSSNVHRTTDDGATWTPVAFAGTTGDTYLDSSGDTVMAVVHAGGVSADTDNVKVSLDGGLTFAVPVLVSAQRKSATVHNNGTVLVVADSISYDSGVTWAEINFAVFAGDVPMPNQFSMQSAYVNNRILYEGVSSNDVLGTIVNGVAGPRSDTVMNGAPYTSTLGTIALILGQNGLAAGS